MSAISTRRDRGERGYTLVEFAVAMSIFLIFISMATPFMFSQLRGALGTENRAGLQQNARAALRTMVRELRQAAELYSNVDKPSGKNKISFGVDFNADGVINAWNSASPLEQVTYYLNQDTLYRGRKQGQGSPLAEDVEDVSYTMFGSNLALDGDADGVVEEDELNTNGDDDGQGNPVWQQAELTNVTRIDISLLVSDQGDSQTYTAQAFLRNRVI